MAAPEPVELKPPQQATIGPLEPKRVRGFATYFKNYMGISSLVTAALPIPVTVARLIPTYSAQAKFLSVYTSLFCFLLLGFVFFVRHRLAGLMFRRRADGTFGSKQFALVPPALIVVCLLMILTYHYALHKSVSAKLSDHMPESTELVLQNADERTIPYNLALMLLYLGIFLSAEGAFIVMATKEYLQDVIGITDAQLFAGELRESQYKVLVRDHGNAQGAFVTVDGEYIGKVPCTLRLTAGLHTVVAEKSGWKIFSEQLNIDPADPVSSLGVSFYSA